MYEIEISSIDEQALRAADRVGLVPRKHGGPIGLDNRGGYMIVDSRTNFPVSGFWYELSAQDVSEFCTD